MQKRTHKLKAMADVEAIVASAPSITAAAAQLGVNPSTLFRAMAAGKVARPSAARSRTAVAAPRSGQSPAAWAKAIRRAYALSSTELQLLVLCVEALTLARDTAAKPEVRLSAMGRYQQLVRQMNLESGDTADGKVETETAATIRAFPRRA